MGATVQLNVRMERSLRDAGNAALQGRHISPSEFVRAVWDKIAQRGQPLEDVLAAVFGETQARGRDFEAEVASPIDQGQTLYATLLHELGMEGTSHADAFVGRGHEQMMEDALLERWREKGLVGE